METRTEPNVSPRCSFCHKPQDAVAKLISSPNGSPRAHICDECVHVCCSILGYTFDYETNSAANANGANTIQEGAIQ
jgi:ATP-dependent protease Clp ATPase subunit